MAYRQPPSDQVDAVYQRLYAGEIDAPSDLIELLLDPLIAALSRNFPDLADHDIVVDIASDTLLRFVQDPTRYDPERSRLWNYLYMDALGDLRNAYAKEQRRRLRQISLDSVAHDVVDRNNEVEEMIIRKIVPDNVPEGMNVATLIAELRADITDERDWEVIRLMAFGERSTAAYVTALGISELLPSEQRRLVKQAKDRLRLRLKRRGVKFNEQ